MHIFHIVTEFSPLIKVGGLGDVVQGLSSSLQKKGIKVSIFLPFYTHFLSAIKRELSLVTTSLKVMENGTTYTNRVWSTKLANLELLFLDPNHPKHYFKRRQIYGETDDLSRFLYFSRAALDYLVHAKHHPDILHLHDWLTGICAPLYFEVHRFLGLEVNGIITTLHNLLYQGVCHPKYLAHIGLRREDLLSQSKLGDNKKTHRVNILKGAIVYSDKISTVSPSYCQEIQENKGFGLESLLRTHRKKLFGILNGIDTDYWNPAIDPYLPYPYPKKWDSLHQIYQAKQKNRQVLAKQVGLSSSSRPLLCSITRIAKQKGPKLILAGLEKALQSGWQVALLGSIVEKNLQAPFKKFRDKYKNHPHAFFFFGFNEKLSHLLFAASDCILIPSCFEPCGLTQMIAFRYGTIPIAHRVGGLKDTIVDPDCSTSSPCTPKKEKNGYLFSTFSPSGVQEAIERVEKTFHEDRKQWDSMIQLSLRTDWSWNKAANQYLELYHSAQLSISHLRKD